jgi:FKBP-type peptidyl-prolyl cis-trans isomerase FklB
MNRQLLRSLMIFVAFACLPIAVGCERLKLDDENARMNYSVGYQVGSDFRRQEFEIDPDIVVQGIADAMAGREPSMTPPEMREALTELQRRAEAADEAVPEESSKTDDDGAE